MKAKKSKSGDFGVRLREIRNETGLSLQELAERLNSEYGASTNKGMLSKYENGVHEPNASLIFCIGRVLNVSVDYLTGKTDDKNPPEIKNADSGEVVSILLPVYSSINNSGGKILEDLFVTIPKTMLTGGREFFALKISGGRLAPRFLSGDIVIVERKKKCAKGSICMVSVEGKDALLCSVINKRDGKVIEPLDPAHESSFYRTAEIHNLPVVIIGEVIELHRKKI